MVYHHLPGLLHLPTSPPASSLTTPCYSPPTRKNDPYIHHILSVLCSKPSSGSHLRVKPVPSIMVSKVFTVTTQDVHGLPPHLCSSFTFLGACAWPPSIILKLFISAYFSPGPPVYILTLHIIHLLCILLASSTRSKFHHLLQYP